MAETNATILIPDISGFTEFMTSTELSHGSFAINMLIDAMIKAVGDEYEVAEIEGDAVLLIRKGQPPSKKEIWNICLRIFNAFHFQRKWMQQHAVCPCGACVGINNLTLKFVVHHGAVAEMKVGRFVKQSGVEMIVAHRLLKNSINNNEYLLVTENLLKQVADSSDSIEMEWLNSSEDYSSIGKIEYRFTLLSDIRKNCPEPPGLDKYYADDTPYSEMLIAANFRDAYMVLMNIPGRPEWVHGLRKVEQDIPQVFVGSIHYCTFKDYEAIVSPLRMILSDDGIVYAESCEIKEMDLSLVHEFIFRRIDENTCGLDYRLMNSGSPVPEEIYTALTTQLHQMVERLKEYCAGIKGASFEPAFQKGLAG